MKKIMGRFNICVFGVLFLLTGCIAGAPSGKHDETLDYFYKFSSVVITGGGIITGIIADHTEPNLMCAISEVPTVGTKVVTTQDQYMTSNNSYFLVSNDRGASFSIYPAPFTMGSNELGRNLGERMAVNPFNTKEIWMGTRTEGLWKSTDRAQTWTNITNYPDATANGSGIVFVIFHPTIPGTIYVSANVPNGLYYTTEYEVRIDVEVIDVEVNPRTAFVLGPAILSAGHTPQSTAPQPMRAILTSNGVMHITYAEFPGPYVIDYGVVFKFDVKIFTWTEITSGPHNSYPAPFSPQSGPSAPGRFCGVAGE